MSGIRKLEILLVGAFFLLSIRLFYLQAILGDEYRKKAQSIHTARIPLVPLRGGVKWSDGTPIARNKMNLVMAIVPAAIPRLRRHAVLQELSGLTRLTMSNLKSKIIFAPRNPYEPVLLRRFLPRTTVMSFHDSSAWLPSIHVNNQPYRYYEAFPGLGHTVGYLGFPNRKDLQDGVKPYHRIGKDGIEKYYDEILHGQDGYKHRVVDVRGTRQQDITPIGGGPRPGKDITLTLDKNIQSIAGRALKGFKGAVIVSKAGSGAVHALVTLPDYDPNYFEIPSPANKRALSKLLKDKEKPFLNRGLNISFPPSSIFKILVTYILLEDDLVNPYDRVGCNGKYQVGDRVFKCWGRHQDINLLPAIRFSCNTYFYDRGILVGPTRIARVARDIFGFGERTGIDLPGESPGLVPDKDWKSKKFKSSWYDGDTANLSIGQGFLKCTPIQVHMFMSSLLSDGVLYVPRLVSKIGNDEIRDREKRRFLMKKTTSSFIKRALHEVTIYGTARQAFSGLKGYAGGKTGTAQHHRRKKPHSWFSGYAYKGRQRKGDPYIITVFCESAGGGGEIAAVIASSVLKSMFYGGDSLAYRNIVFSRMAAASLRRSELRQKAREEEKKRMEAEREKEEREEKEQEEKKAREAKKKKVEI